MHNNDRLLKIIEKETLLLHNTDGGIGSSLPAVADVQALMQAIWDTIFFEGSCHHHCTGAEITQGLLTVYTRLHHLLDRAAPEKDTGISTTETAMNFIERMHSIRELLITDIRAILVMDPAATSPQEVIACYPAVKAVLYYRSAHEMVKLGIPILPRMITELAHSITGIDIHPNAKIGPYFAIDHGTGIVIGETSIIGSHVTLYQGVTLGAKAFSYDENGLPQRIDRHPIIEDNVTIYSNSSILGRITIGHDTVIGGNIWVTQSVPPHSKITQKTVISMC
ncbi:MAG: serine acetyltransferase [Bacteroides sp.]|nr:serine acetyltransferase [Bacteroides sp.]MBD5348067.1 serine acetyltransferase [Bacteroides sp.]